MKTAKCKRQNSFSSILHFEFSFLQFAILFAVLVGSCAPNWFPSTPQAITPSLVWPQPPQRPRIRFVMTVARPQDLGIESSLWKRLGEFIFGKEEEWLIRPTGIVARGQVIYVADPGAQVMWILDASAGRFQRIQEAGGQRLVSPVAAALGTGDRIYLADSYLAKVFIYDGDGHLIETIANAAFRRPTGLAYDAKRDRLYVVDSAAHNVWVLTGAGGLVGAIGRRGTSDGEFNFPTHVTVDREGTLYVTDSLAFRAQSFSSDGKFLGQFGRHGDSSGNFAMPKGLALDSEGHIYVVDALFDAVQIFDLQGQYLLTFGERGLGPGQFWLPGGIFVDPRDRIYVADAYNQRIQIFEYLAGRGP